MLLYHRSGHDPGHNQEADDILLPKQVTRMTESNDAPETRILEQIQDLMGEILGKSSERDGSCLYRGEPECYPIASSGLYRNCPDCKDETFDIERVQQENH